MSKARHMNHDRWVYRMMRSSERSYAREREARRTGRYTEPRWIAWSFRDADYWRALLIGDLARAKAIHEMTRRAVR